MAESKKVGDGERERGKRGRDQNQEGARFAREKISSTSEETLKRDQTHRENPYHSLKKKKNEISLKLPSSSLRKKHFVNENLWDIFPSVDIRI